MKCWAQNRYQNKRARWVRVLVVCHLHCTVCVEFPVVGWNWICGFLCSFFAIGKTRTLIFRPVAFIFMMIIPTVSNKQLPLKSSTSNSQVCAYVHNRVCKRWRRWIPIDLCFSSSNVGYLELYALCHWLQLFGARWYDRKTHDLVQSRPLIVVTYPCNQLRFYSRPWEPSGIFIYELLNESNNNDNGKEKRILAAIPPSDYHSHNSHLVRKLRRF